MNKTTLALAAMLAVAVSPAMAGIKEIGTINGVKIYRIKTMGVFVPSTTTIVTANTNTPGVLGTLNDATSPGILGQVAEAGGQVGAAAVRRPDKTKVQVENGSSAGATAGSNATGGNGNGGAGGAGGTANGGGQFVPPGHINNPSGNH